MATSLPSSELIPLRSDPPQRKKSSLGLSSSAAETAQIREGNVEFFWQQQQPRDAMQPELIECHRVTKMGGPPFPHAHPCTLASSPAFDAHLASQQVISAS